MWPCTSDTYLSLQGGCTLFRGPTSSCQLDNTNKSLSEPFDCLDAQQCHSVVAISRCNGAPSRLRQYPVFSSTTHAPKLRSTSVSFFSPFPKMQQPWPESNLPSGARQHNDTAGRKCSYQATAVSMLHLKEKAKFLQRHNFKFVRNADATTTWGIILLFLLLRIKLSSFLWNVQNGRGWTKHWRNLLVESLSTFKIAKYYKL